MRSDFNMSDYVEGMREAIMREAQNTEESKPAISLPPQDVCDLCHRTGQELRSYGSPTPYFACIDVGTCEMHRKEDVDFGSQKGWPE